MRGAAGILGDCSTEVAFNKLVHAAKLGHIHIEVTRVVHSIVLEHYAYDSRMLASHCKSLHLQVHTACAVVTCNEGYCRRCTIPMIHCQ